MRKRRNHLSDLRHRTVEEECEPNPKERSQSVHRQVNLDLQPPPVASLPKYNTRHNSRCRFRRIFSNFSGREASTGPVLVAEITPLLALLAPLMMKDMSNIMRILSKKMKRKRIRATTTRRRKKTLPRSHERTNSRIQTTQIVMVAVFTSPLL